MNYVERNTLPLSLHKGGYHNRAWVAKKRGIVFLGGPNCRNQSVDLIPNGSKLDLYNKKKLQVDSSSLNLSVPRLKIITDPKFWK